MMRHPIGRGAQTGKDSASKRGIVQGDSARGCGANDCFEYSVPLAKTVCLGNVSALAGKGSTLAWDGHRVTNDAAADRHVTKAYRKGWDPFA